MRTLPRQAAEKPRPRDKIMTSHYITLNNIMICMQHLSRDSNTKLLLAEVIAVYKELKELVVGAELDFCPHAYTTTASPRPTLNPKRKSTEPSQQIKNVRTLCP